MKVFVTSDIHFQHKGILNYCPHRRNGKPMPESDYDIVNMVSEMNETIIRNWNSKVGVDDEVWILGDVSMGQIDKSAQYISRLNGIKHLVAGNHDVKLVKMCRAQEPGFENLFVSIDKMYNMTYDYDEKKYSIVMCHFPMLHWDKQTHGAIQLFGHMHSAPDKRFPNEWRQMDVGMDGANLYPYSMDEIMEIMVKRSIKNIDHHN